MYLHLIKKNSAVYILFHLHFLYQPFAQFVGILQVYSEVLVSLLTKLKKWQRTPFACGWKTLLIGIIHFHRDISLGPFGFVEEKLRSTMRQ